MHEVNSAPTQTCSVATRGMKDNPVNNIKKKSQSKKVANIDLEQAITRWGDTVFRLALCKTKKLVDAEDITQMVFLKLCQKRDPFKNDEHLKAWLLRVTLTCSIDFKRDPWEKQRTTMSDLGEVLEYKTAQQNVQVFSDTDSVLYESLIAEKVSTLSEKQGIAIHLYYFENYSTKEIAQIMDEKPTTVRSHLHRARITLKTMIGETDE